MKIVKVIIVSLLVIILTAAVWSTLSYNNYTPAAVMGMADAAANAYYKDTYSDARSQFRADSALLVKKYSGARISSFTVPSKKDTDLTVDMLYIPAKKIKKGLIIFSSAVHGVEGFVGSAVQAMVMKEFITESFLKDTGVLFIHGINPYGFKNNRRTTENNVDLNRNCSSSPGLYKTVNAGYQKVNGLINPAGPVNTRSIDNVFFHIKSIYNIIKASMPVLRQAIVQGQYAYPRGVYYGGVEPEYQIVKIGQAAASYSSGYANILTVDLHTGYGKNGVLHLFPNPAKTPEIKKLTEQVFKGYTIDWGDAGEFYTTTGDFADYIGQLVKGKHIPMVIEYGTLDSQATIGSINSLHRTILENQGYNHGYASEKDKLRVQKLFREMYYPSCAQWQTKIVYDTRILLKSAISNFTGL